MNSVVLLGLAVVLVLILLRSRRRRASAATVATDGADSAAATTRSFGLRRRRPAAEPELRDPVAPAAAPASFVSAPAPLEVPRPSPVAPRPPADWTPDEMIVEPGWPLPGEISSSWSAAPEATTDSMPLVAPAVAETAATAVVEDGTDALETAGSWEMPVMTPIAVTEAPSAAHDAEPPAPDEATPAWVPGAIEETATPAWPADDAGLPAWSPEPSDPDPAVAWSPEGTLTEPAIEWDLAEDVPSSGEAVAPEPTVPPWVPEAPADAAPETETEPEPEAEPEPMAEAEPVAEPEPMAEPVAEPEPEPHPLLGPLVADMDPWTPALDGDVVPPVADEVAPPASPAVFVAFQAPHPEPAGDWSAIPDPEPDPAGTDIATQSAEVAELVPEVLAALRPLVQVSDHAGMTPRALVVLGRLAAQPLSVGELSALLGVSRPVLADIARRLVDGGLARRERCADDRRRVRMVLTPEGRRLHDRTPGGLPVDAVTVALARMEAAERDGLLAGLRALHRTARD